MTHIRMYECIYGPSGTLGLKGEQNLLGMWISTVYIPTYKKKQFVELPVKHTLEKDERAPELKCKKEERS